MRIAHYGCSCCVVLLFEFCLSCIRRPQPAWLESCKCTHGPVPDDHEVIGLQHLGDDLTLVRVREARSGARSGMDRPRR